MSRSSQVDVGLSHVALLVTSVARSADFYARYARMEVVHRRRSRAGRGIVWLSDLSRPFVIVLIEADTIEGRLEGVAHLGVGCASREEVDQLCERARGEGCLDLGPEDGGPPVGYWALLRDPDGHNLELSYGQQVGRAVRETGALSREAASPRPAA
ncbi:MAG: VOC family protein [Proteobacteria bacterium]|nr:VOC family protein [Pseudomonadota bacterium]